MDINNISKDIIQPYINEIISNAKLTIILLESSKKFNKYDFKKVQYYSLAVTTASSTLQIIDYDLAKTNLAKKRIDLIKRHYPNIPSFPENLRNIRNHIQHFDERMDDWFFKSLEKHRGFAMIIDQDRNIEEFSNFKDVFCQYNRTVNDDNQFLYWKHKINILELEKWCSDIIQHFS